MGPKATSAERLRAFGAKAAEYAKKRFPDCGFACVYTGGAGAVAKRSQVCFEWTVCLGNFEETCGIEMNCLNADRQGVRFPDHWRIAIPCVRLRDLGYPVGGGAAIYE